MKITFLKRKCARKALPSRGDMAKELIIENLEEGFMVIASDETILFSNKLACTLLEKNLFSITDIIEGKVKQIKCGETVYEIRCSKLPEGKKIEGYIVRFLDITQLMQQQKELLALKEKADENSRYKSTFLANMSHEIRTPIHAIIGFSELVMKEEISADIREKMDMIKSSSYSLLAIINDVLDISKIESGKMELVNTKYYISYIIRDIEATFSMLAKQKGLSFQADIDEKLPCRLYGDKIRIRGILVNILNNAIKYTKEGSVSFAIHRLEQTEDRVKLAFIMKDTGVGIRQEDKDKLFETFQRLDKRTNYAVEGTGLGLPIAHAYAEMMGGEIRVESEYGKGSVFTVILEQQIVDAAPIDMKYIRQEEEEVLKKFRIHHYPILVVDDNQVNLVVAEGLLKTYGLTVQVAASGQEAVRLCAENQYPMIFMDQMMPEMDGKQTMEAIRRLSGFYEKETKFIVLTADAMSGARKRLLKEGFDEYLCKPLELQKLENMLLQMIPKEHVEFYECQKEEKEPDEEKDKAQIEALSAALGIDSEILEERIEGCGGRIEDYLNICRIACRHGYNKINKLQNTRQTGDYENYIIEVHSLKSTAANLGAMEISRQAKEQEYAGRQGNYSLIDEKSEELLKNYQKFLEKLESVIAKNQTEEISEEEVLKPEEARRICEKIGDLIETFEFGSIFDILEKVRPLPKSEKEKVLFDSIEKSMDEMDIEGVKILLEEME